MTVKHFITTSGHFVSVFDVALLLGNSKKGKKNNIDIEIMTGYHSLLAKQWQGWTHHNIVYIDKQPYVSALRLLQVLVKNNKHGVQFLDNMNQAESYGITLEEIFPSNELLRHFGLSSIDNLNK